MRLSIAALWILTLSLTVLSAACRETKPAEPSYELSEDRVYLPFPDVPRSVDLATSDENAVDARQEISAILGISRLLLSRTRTPLEMLRGLTWTWEAVGCLWIRVTDAQGCPCLIQSCDQGERIRWTIMREETCVLDHPHRVYPRGLTLQGWSAPFGVAGRIFTSAANDTTAVEDRVQWVLLSGTRTLRWQLTEMSSSGEDLQLAFEWNNATDGRDSYDFTFPDSLRWTGTMAPQGASGEIAVYRWRPALGGWFLWDEFSWERARGRWTHHGAESAPVVRLWGD